MLSNVLDEETGELMEYRKLRKNPNYRLLYRNSYAKEIRRLEQGMSGLVEGTNTIFFIEKTAVPADRWKDVTYGRIVVDYRPDKTDTYHTIITVGGGRVNYPGDCGTTTVELTTVNLLLNSIFSKLNAKSMTIDIRYFYLNTLMDQSEYMHLKLRNFPNSVVQHYNLVENTIRVVYAYVEIKQGMYGLPQEGLIDQQLL